MNLKNSMWVLIIKLYYVHMYGNACDMLSIVRKNQSSIY